MEARKTNGQFVKKWDLDTVKKHLPDGLSIVETTYSEYKSKATFIDSEYGEFQHSAWQIISRGKSLHPQRIRKENSERVSSKAVQDKMKASNLKRYGAANPMQSSEVRKRFAETMTHRFGTSHPSKSPLLHAKAQENYRTTCVSKYGVEHHASSPEFKLHPSGIATSGPARMLAEMLKNRNFSFRMDDYFEGIPKQWDFIIEEKLAVDIDGELYHGLSSDNMGAYQCSTYRDADRLTMVPDNVSVLLIDGRNAKSSINEIVRLLGSSAEEEKLSLLAACLSSPFPYPSYSETRMRRDFRRLKRSYAEGSGFRPTDIGGNSIITNFHKSIYSARRGSLSSPVEAWDDPSLLKKSIDNRYIYSSSLSSQKIAKGFEISKIAPRVSVFSAALARYLLMTYAPESSTVLDPFSGFSGRLLGAASLDKAYIGFDVSEKVVQESQQIVDFLKLPNVFVSVKDIRKPCAITYPEADVLLTCPPYGLKESWEEVPPNMLLDSTDDYIDLVLSKCCAKTYLFIVDETLKYSSNIVQKLKRRSHLREDGNELVLLFKKS